MGTLFSVMHPYIRVIVEKRHLISQLLQNRVYDKMYKLLPSNTHFYFHGHAKCKQVTWSIICQPRPH